jgi:hypothetical protein
MPQESVPVRIQLRDHVLNHVLFRVRQFCHAYFNGHPSMPISVLSSENFQRCNCCTFQQRLTFNARFLLGKSTDNFQSYFVVNELFSTYNPKDGINAELQPF